MVAIRGRPDARVAREGRSGRARRRAGRRAGRTVGLLCLTVVVLAGVAACGGKKVTRIEPTAVTDLSGRWNDTDSRLVARALIEQSLDSRWAREWSQRHGGRLPTVIVGAFRNRTLEHVPVNTFVNDLENAFLASGRVQVVARPGDERGDIRAERDDQQEHARADTRARPAQEVGATFMLQGELQAIEDEEGRERVVYYQVDATLIDLETNLKIWTGQHEIKKYIERRRFGF